MAMNLPQKFEDTIEGGYVYRQDQDKDKPLNAKQVDHNFVATAKKLNELEDNLNNLHPESIPNASDTVDGLMSKTDFTKLKGLKNYTAGNNITIDDATGAISATSSGGSVAGGLVGVSKIIPNLGVIGDSVNYKQTIAVFNGIVLAVGNKGFIIRFDTNNNTVKICRINSVNNDFNGIVVNSSGIFLISSVNGIFKTSDFGESFESLGYRCYELTIKNNIAYSCYSNGILILSGNNFENIELKTFPSNVAGLALSSTVVGNTIIVVGQSNGFAGVSNDSGVNYTLSYMSGRNATKVVTNKNNVSVAICLDGIVRYYSSITGWSLSTAISASLRICNIEIGIDGRFVVCGASALISYSDDGNNWISSSVEYASALTTYKLYGIANYGNTWVCVGSNGLILVSTDNAKNFKLKNLRMSGYNLYSVQYIGNNKFIATGENSEILLSDDNLDFYVPYKQIAL